MDNNTFVLSLLNTFVFNLFVLYLLWHVADLIAAHFKR